MILYLIKVIICSGLFYLFYLLLLEREKMPVFNRFYLLVSLLFSYCIPLIKFTVQLPAITATTDKNLSQLDASATSIVTPHFEHNTIISAEIIAWFIILSISFILLVRFVIGLVHLIKKIRNNNEHSYYKNIRLIAINNSFSPYSFGKYIFVNTTETDERILYHEYVHIKQKHWLDNLLMEIMTIISWMNPLVFLHKKSIKINHEFLADEAVVNHFGNSKNYQTLLLQKVFAQNNIPLASTFYFSITKKRLLMLNKTTSAKQKLLLTLLSLPLAAMLTFLLSDRIYAQEVIPPPPPPVTEKKDNVAPPPSLNKITNEKGVTEKEMQEYKEIAQKAHKGNNRYFLNEKDSKRTSHLYKKMNKKQQKNSRRINPTSTTARRKRHFTTY